VKTSLLIGSGAAAAGAAAALLEDPTQRVLVLDVGNRLEADLEATRVRLAQSREEDWMDADIQRIARLPDAARSGGLPQKRSYGSNFPFSDVGQLDGVAAAEGTNGSVVSGAYGGFSNLWGAQIMPFSRATFDRWPVSYAEMEQHYRFAQREMSLAADRDDLVDLFPLPNEHHALPPLDERTEAVLKRYTLARASLQSRGITVGRARLALQADMCTRCAMCMTGCPYGLIYSASQSFDRLRPHARLDYRSNLLVFRVEQNSGAPRVLARELRTGETMVFEADRVFIGCGAIGSTRLVLGSRARLKRPVAMAESAQFVVPTVSMHAVRDPRDERRFTLNQFNLLYDASGDGRDLCQIHFYPYNELFLRALPHVLQRPATRTLTKALLRRLSVGLGYLPSWRSPPVTVTAYARGAEELPGLSICGSERSGWPPMLKRFVAQLLRAAPSLDLWPILPSTTLSGPAKSYHFGSSFPHHEVRSATTTDRLGRLEGWDRVHLIDAAVFPDVPATTFTLTVMANAHRIAAETLRLAE